MTDQELLKAAIRTIPDYPKPGILFRDITTLLGDARAFRMAVDAITARHRDSRPHKVAGLEARGFILGGAVAAALEVGFVPIRKRGKLPFQTVRAAYTLEYGEDELEMHIDAVKPGERVLVVDDLIATGGTALAAIDVLGRVGAEVVGSSYVIDLPDLGGSTRLEKLGISVHALVTFPGH